MSHSNSVQKLIVRKACASGERPKPPVETSYLSPWYTFVHCTTSKDVTSYDMMPYHT